MAGSSKALAVAVILAATITLLLLRQCPLSLVESMQICGLTCRLAKHVPNHPLRHQLSYSNVFSVVSESTGDIGGSQSAGYIDTGDWMSYTAVTIPTTGTYTVAYRVTSLSGGGSLRLERAGGTPVYGTRSIPSTGGWANLDNGLAHRDHNSLTAIGFWREPKNSHRTQESPPWQASAASSGVDSTVNPDPTQTGRGRVAGGGVGRSNLLELIN